MRSLKRIFLILWIGAGLAWGAPLAVAADDGFSYDKKEDGQYLTVYFQDGLDESGLARQLDVRPADMVLSGGFIRPRRSGEAAGLVQMLDALYSQVSDILDMHLNDLKPGIKICRTYADLNSIYERLFGKSLGGRFSFYVYDFNTIYVSAENFQQGVIGHEMAHSIISHFFPVAAPVKVQEVLAMYVEYNLRRPQ